MKTQAKKMKSSRQEARERISYSSVPSSYDYSKDAEDFYTQQQYLPVDKQKKCHDPKNPEKDESSLMASLYMDILNTDNMTKNERRLWHMKNFHNGTFPLINGLSSIIHSMYNDLSEFDGELKEMTVQGGKYGPNLSIGEENLVPMQHQLALGNY